MPGFDPDQPRDEKGQWTSGGGSMAMKSAASDIKMGDPDFLVNLLGTNSNGKENPDERASVIKEFVDKMNNEANLPTEIIIDTVDNAIRHQPIETIALFKEDGDLVGMANGDEGHVGMKIKPDEVRGGIATHNHPLDQSFSNGDIYTAVQIGLKEMRAVSAANDYIFRPNYDYGHSDMNDSTADFIDRMLGTPPLINAYNNSLMDVQKSYTDAIEAGALDLKSANANFQHKIMQVFAERTGSYYEKRPLPSVRTDVPRDLYKTSSYPDFEQAEKVRQRNIVNQMVKEHKQTADKAFIFGPTERRLKIKK